MPLSQIKPIEVADIDAVVEFLKIQNMHVTAEQLNYLLIHNPKYSQMLIQKEEVIAVVLCSFDGLKAYLNNLVVAEAFRKQGWGQKLISAVVSQLKKIACPELVINCKPFLQEWYAKQGFVKQDTTHYVLRLKDTDDETLSCG